MIITKSNHAQYTFKNNQGHVSKDIHSIRLRSRSRDAVFMIYPQLRKYEKMPVKTVRSMEIKNRLTNGGDIRGIS